MGKHWVLLRDTGKNCEGFQLKIICISFLPIDISIGYLPCSPSPIEFQSAPQHLTFHILSKYIEFLCYAVHWLYFGVIRMSKLQWLSDSSLLLPLWSITLPPESHHPPSWETVAGYKCLINILWMEITRFFCSENLCTESLYLCFLQIKSCISHFH